MKVWLTMNLDEWGACITSSLICNFCSWRLPLTFQAYLLFSRPSFSLAMPSSLNKLLRLQGYQPYFGLSIVQIVVLILRFSGISHLSHILWAGTSLEVPSETSFCLPWHLKLHLVEGQCPECGKWPSLIQTWSEGLYELLDSACCEWTWVTTTCPFKNEQEVMGGKE